MLPAVDLRRVTFPTADLTVSEHGAERLQVVTDGWILSVLALDSGRAANVMNAFRAGVGRSLGCREDVLDAPKGPAIHRFLIGNRGAEGADKATYVISLDDARMVAEAWPRTPGGQLDVAAVDRLLLAFGLSRAPRPGAEVLPGWQAYQRGRGPDSPVAKFVLHMAPAPVRLGNSRTALRDASLPTEADFERGGRQVAPDLIEFYAEDDPSAIRVDVWVGDRPGVEGRKLIYEAGLRVGSDPFAVGSLDEPHEAPVPSGEYDLSITLLNRGVSSDRNLTEREWFDRDDLERYEIWLKRRPDE